MFIFDSRPPNPTPGTKSMRSGTHKTDAKNNSTRYTYILIFHRTWTILATCFVIKVSIFRNNKAESNDILLFSIGKTSRYISSPLIPTGKKVTPTLPEALISYSR